MVHQQFAERVVEVVNADPAAIGLAVAGSWLSNELDEYSDLDLILVTKSKVGGDKEKMMAWAERFGKLLTAFTGEHVGEPRLLICLYDDPLLHVDIKFLTSEEFALRVEEPVVLADPYGMLEQSLQLTVAEWPQPDHQWIEDRFWVWTHYALTKTGRGEYFEALDFLSFMRNMVLGPLLLTAQGKLPRGVRKLEMHLPEELLTKLKGTIGTHDFDALMKAIAECVAMYRGLRAELFSADVNLQTETEKKVLEYYDQVAGLMQRQ